MPIDKKPGESKDDFISRCISIEVKDGKPQNQAVAICISKWQNMAEVGKRGAIVESPKAPKSDTPNKNPKGEGTAKGDASGKRGAEVTERVEDILREKVDDFNKRYKEKLGYGVDIGVLKTVYQRGVGAFNVSHSPRVQSAEQWALARVNAFLYIIKNGRPENPKYVNDNDLLPAKHPKNESKKKEEMKFESFSDYGDDVKANAKRVLEYVEQNGWGSCGTPVGKVRANQLANGEPISVDTIQRMYSYLTRHEVDLETSTSYSDGCGKLMYDSWGGKSALSWSRNKLRELGMIEASATASTDFPPANINFDKSEKFRKVRRVLFDEDFNEDLIKKYKADGWKIHIMSKRKIKRPDKKRWNKMKSVNLSEDDHLVYGELKDLDNRYNYDTHFCGEDDPILTKLLLTGKPHNGKGVLASQRIESLEDAKLLENWHKEFEMKFATVRVVFVYEEIPGIPAAASGSRPFCKKLIATNKEWTLDEISNLPTEHLVKMGLEPDVLSFRGGFYRNPNSNQTTPFCRHQWTAKVVRS